MSQTLKAGDFVFLTPDPNWVSEFLYINHSKSDALWLAQVLQVSPEEGTMQIRWLWRPEQTYLTDGLHWNPQEIFWSDDIDEQDIESMDGVCQVVHYSEFDERYKSKPNTFYFRYSYHSASRSFVGVDKDGSFVHDEDAVKEKLSLLDLNCGVGGMSYGLASTGFVSCDWVTDENFDNVKTVLSMFPEADARTICVPSYLHFMNAANKEKLPDRYFISKYRNHFDLDLLSMRSIKEMEWMDEWEKFIFRVEWKFPNDCSWVENVPDDLLNEFIRHHPSEYDKAIQDKKDYFDSAQSRYNTSSNIEQSPALFEYGNIILDYNKEKGVYLLCWEFHPISKSEWLTETNLVKMGMQSLVQSYQRLSADEKSYLRNVYKHPKKHIVSILDFNVVGLKAREQLIQHVSVFLVQWKITLSVEKYNQCWLVYVR
eukprot:TRINITY_DN951_c0_g1_i3.p1 TRINITY_DN951_c0_g1~~TRINITY_DN951_c0_g1_i3.p1  ORF type:complete len:427 (-),score=74.89 TRINITY_DN951_c0_g1_i3:159-1439(-)